MAELLNLQDKITELQAVCNASAAKQAEEQQKKKDEEEEKLLKEIEALQLQLASTQNGRDNKEKRDTKNYGYNRQVTQNTAHNPPPHHWHKDFKIAGQIGEPGQKDKLTFSSLARQIEHGLSKGFPEPEIVDAVIRAIVPGMQLRSYLEGKVNLSLPTLRRILRSHYQEKSATDLYTQLTSEVQGLKETPQNFLIRTLDLRQKILFASQESESGLQYDPGLVQRMFLHTVLTGLQNDNIKRDLQPYLEQADISDELLLERMNTACAHETERQMKKKMAGQQKPVTVHSAQSSDVPAEKNEKPATNQNPKVSPVVLSQLEEIKSEIAVLKDLKVEVSQIRESMLQPQHTPRPQPPAGGADGTSGLQFSGQQMQDLSQSYWFNAGPRHRGGTAQYQQRFAPQRSFPPPNRGRMRRCFGCQQSGAEDYCTHCYRCGSSKHFLAGCRARGQRQFGGEPLNGGRSFARDREWTNHTARSQQCAHCGQRGEGVILKQCTSCKNVLYCSRPCQVDNWAEHKKHCKPLSCMTANATSKREKQAKRAPLVGERHMVNCFIQGQRVQALWDSGSQVTIIDELWKEVHLPDTRLRDISDILDVTPALDIKAANGESMPYTSWVEIAFRLASGAAAKTEVIVPTLVMKGGKLAQPIIGSNVIKIIIDSELKQSDTTHREQLSKTVRAAFPGHTDTFVKQVTAVVEQVSVRQANEYVVKTKRERVNIPKHLSVQVECHVHMDSPPENATLIFEPDVNLRWTEGLELCDMLVEVTRGTKKPSITVSVQNPTNHDIVLAGRTVIGTVQNVQAVYPTSMLERSRPLSLVTTNHITAEVTSASQSRK